MPYRKKFDKKLDVESFLEYNREIKTHWTMRELAINLDYASSTKFNNVIWEMVDEGRVCVQFSTHIKYSAVPRKAFVCLPEDYNEQLEFVEIR